MVSSLGLPPLQPPPDRGELNGIPGALAVVPEVLLHHSPGEFYLSVKKIAAGFFVTWAAFLIGCLGDGEAGYVLPILPWLFLATAGWHRWTMFHRGPNEHVHSTSPGISHADRYFTAFRQAWVHPPPILQRCLADNTLLYLLVQPALVLILGWGLVLTVDVDGGRFLFCAGLAMGWHAARIHVARRRTVAALRDAPIQQAEMVAIARQDLLRSVPQGRAYTAQSFSPPVASAALPVRGGTAPSPLEQLQRMESTVARSLTSPPLSSQPMPPAAPDPGVESPPPEAVQVL